MHNTKRSDFEEEAEAVRRAGGDNWDRDRVRNVGRGTRSNVRTGRYNKTCESC